MENTNHQPRKLKAVLLPLAAVLLIILLTIGAFLWQQNKKSTDNKELVNAETLTTVVITDKGFVPETVTIKRGQQVQWINQDVTGHQVAPDPHPHHTSFPALSETDEILPNQAMSFIFEEAGTITYHDELHPLDYKGVIEVVE